MGVSGASFKWAWSCSLGRDKVLGTGLNGVISKA